MLSRGAGTRKQLVVLLATTGAGLALAAAGPTGSAGAAPTTCQGQPVTIVATADASTVQGTGGPDVIDGAGHGSLTILGLGGDDVICSGPESPMAIHGGGGDDRIEMRVSPVQHAADNAADGGAGDDELVFVGDGYGEGRGGEGDDRFVDSTTSSGYITVTPGPGDDAIVGNPDSTHLVFGGTTGVRISVGEGRAEGEGHDTFSGIQAFVGTTASDTFVGSGSNDTFLGGPWTRRFAPSGAPDRAYGGDGYDSLEVVGRAEGGKGGDRLRVYGPTAAAWGGPGNDSLRLFPGSTCTAACRLRADGGASVDRMTLRPGGRQGVRIDLASGRASMGARGRVALAGVEDLIGTKRRDVLIGNARRNSFHGDHGDDVLQGRGGADALTGGRGRDLLVGGRGRDRLRRLGSRPVPDGGERGMLNVERRRGPVVAATVGLVALGAVSVGLGAAAAPAEAAVRLCQGEAVTIRATTSNSTVLGTEGPDVIDGMGHFALKIQGLGGDDVICSGDGTYIVIGGGDGDDRIEAGGPGGYAVALGAAGDDELVFVGDRGGSGGGGEGDDRIVDATTGTRSDDVVRVSPGGGDDTVVGRRGSTELVFRGETGVRISVAERTADGEGHDTFSGIERYVGTQSSDTFLGSGGRDAFVGGTRASAGAVGGAPDVAYGGDGKDTLTLTGRAEGGAGADRLQVHGRRSVAIGGPGDDELYVEAGRTCTSRAVCDVRVDAGAGQDGITLRPRDRRGVRVDLSLGRARLRGGRVSFVGVEKVYGTPYRDVLIGDDRRNTLVGEGGDDLMRGRGSRDLLIGGRGKDRAEGGAGRDRCRAEVRRSC